MARIGLVLGAGGVVGGAFHAGVLAALAEDIGWDARDAELVVGTSAGSSTGALLRAGMPPADLFAETTGGTLSDEARHVLARSRPRRSSSLRVDRRPLRLRPVVTAPKVLMRSAMRPWEARVGLLAAALLPAGTVPTQIISDIVAPHFPVGWPDRLLWITAVHLSTGRRVVFGRADAPMASVGDAVAASCAIPGFFEPVVIGGSRYIDGGAHSPTNLDLVAGMGFDLVVVSSPMSRAGSLLGRIGPVRQWARLELDREMRRVTRSGTPVLAFQPTSADLPVMGLNAMDLARRGPVALQVRESARRWLADARNSALVEVLAKRR